MFTAVYQWRAKPGREQDFIRAWTRMTEIIFEREGSLGSRLHRADNGCLIAYAQWPSRQAWDDAALTPSTPEAEQLRRVMRDSAERILPDILMEVIEDRLATIAANSRPDGRRPD